MGNLENLFMRPLKETGCVLVDLCKTLTPMNSACSNTGAPVLLSYSKVSKLILCCFSCVLCLHNVGFATILSRYRCIYATTETPLLHTGALPFSLTFIIYSVSLRAQLSSTGTPWSHSQLHTFTPGRFPVRPPSDLLEQVGFRVLKGTSLVVSGKGKHQI